MLINIFLARLFEEWELYDSPWRHTLVRFLNASSYLSNYWRYWIETSHTYSLWWFHLIVTTVSKSIYTFSIFLLMVLFFATFDLNVLLNKIIVRIPPSCLVHSIYGKNVNAIESHEPERQTVIPFPYRFLKNVKDVYSKEPPSHILY